MKGPIRRITRERLEERADTLVHSAWLGGAPVRRMWSDGAWLTKRAPEAPPTNGTPVLVMLGTDATVNAALLRHAVNGARTYVLVDPKSDAQGLNAPNVLARRVPEVPASALHASTHARVWIGGGVSLKLDERQAEALRQTFLRLFWHEATDEAWLDGRQLVWRPARERPFDVPEVLASAPIRWESPDARLAIDLSGAQVHLMTGAPPSVAPQRLWFPAGAEHHDRLAKLAQSGAEVLWDDLGLADLAVTSTSGEVLLPGARGRLRVQMTMAQAQEARALLNVDATWRFRTNVRIGEPALHRASFWLAGEAAPRKLEDEQIIDAPNVQATSLRDVHTSEPASVPAPQPLALSARYRWSVVPPHVPAGSEEDPLVKRWRDIDEGWLKRLAAVRGALEKSDAERSRLSKTFSRLFSGLLGFERTHQGLLSEVNALTSERPSKAGPTNATALISRLEALEDAARNHQGDLDDAERKAREDEEREKQHREWASQVDRAKTEAARAREDLAQEEKRRDELADEAKEIDARSANAALEEKRDLDARRKRNSDDRKKNDERLSKLRFDMGKHEKDVARPFTFKAEAKAQPPKGTRFVPTAAAARSSILVPEDALPEVGALRLNKGKRYLVIDTWEHLDAGEQAASRLSAKLVAPEDA